MAEPRHAAGPGDPRTAERGHALITALIATALLLPLGAFAVMQARLDFLVQHHTRAASEALAIAEAGLEQALADCARDPRFDRLSLGPDGRAGTGDDGQYPFAIPPPAFFPAAPYRYEVRVAALSADRLEIHARGYGVLGSVRGVAAAVLRAPVPYLPGALASDAAPLDLLLGPDLHVTGADGDAAHPAVPAVAVRGGEIVDQLLAQLDAAAQARLTGPGGPPSLRAAALPEVATLLDGAARRAETRTLGGEVSGALGDGLFVAAGALRLHEVSGSGILLVDGPLELSGTLTFEGLIAVRGDVRAAADSHLALAGTLLQSTPGRALLLRGSGRIVYDPRVADRLAAAWPGLLPARARVTGWRELPEPGE